MPDELYKKACAAIEEWKLAGMSTSSAYVVETRWSGSEHEPSRVRMDAILAELDTVDPEYPDTWLTHSPGWTIAADEDRYLVLSNPDQEVIGYIANVSRQQMLEFWETLARGEVEALLKEPWRHGRPVVRKNLSRQLSMAISLPWLVSAAGGGVMGNSPQTGKTATYGYDALNRVTSLTYPDQAISYTYDSGTNQKERLTQVTDGSGSTTWTYDAQGRVPSRQQSVGVTKSVGYAYDPSGRLRTLTLPSGNTIDYGYTDGKVTSLTLNGSTTILSDVLYQPFGPMRSWAWGNSTLAVREYSTDGLITAVDSAGLKSYGYDDAFRITEILDAGNAALSQSYGYDLLDRLTSASGSGLNQGWTYDANGNRLTQTGDQPSSYTVSGTSNRLSSISGAVTRSYAYGASGNVTGDGTATFGYDDADRLVSVTKAGVTTTYALNALGQRVRKTSAGASTHFVYDEAGHLVGEYANTGALIQETVWLGDIPVATIRPNGASVELFYVHADHLNTPRRISRPSDNVIVWRWDSDPFGTSAASQDPDGDAQAFVYGLPGLRDGAALQLLQGL